MIYDTDKYKKKVYNFICKGLFSNGSMLDLGVYLKRLKISSNMEKYVMPIFQFKFFLPPEFVVMLQTDSDKLTITLEGKMLNVDSSSSVDYDTYFDQIELKPLFMDKTPVNVNTKLINMVNNEYSANNQRAEFELIAVPTYCLDVNKHLASGVYSDCTVTEAVLALTNSLDEVTTYLSPLDNTNRYDQIILIPSNIVTNIKYIDNNYGLYDDDLRIFMNRKILNISSIHGKSSLDDGNINLNINFPINKEESQFYAIGSYRIYNDSKSISSILVNDTLNSIALTESTELNIETYGNSNYFLNRDLQGLSFNRKASYDEDTSVYKTKVYNNTRNNIHGLENFSNRVINNRIIYYNFSDMDISFNDIFKTVYVKFNSVNYDDLYSGDYCMTTMDLNFYIDDKSAATLSGQMKLIKK